jgi:transposase
MSKTKRNRYSAEFKAKVAMAAMKEDATLSEIATRFEIHPNLVGLWKKEAVSGLSSVFSGKANRVEVSQEVRIKELHEKIGQLTVERDFLARAFGK